MQVTSDSGTSYLLALLIYVADEFHCGPRHYKHNQPAAVLAAKSIAANHGKQMGGIFHFWWRGLKRTIFPFLFQGTSN